MKTDEKNISDDEFIKCPYCPKLLKKIDDRHLRIHKKKLKDMLIEIPDVKIITRQAYDDYIEGEKKRKVGSKAATSKKKKLICYFCKTEFEGSVFTQDICRCKECKKKGLSTPAAIEAHEKSKAAIVEKFGVENVSHLKEVVEKRKVTFEKHKKEDENFMNRIYEKRENTVEEKFSTDCLTGRQFLTGKSRATYKEKTGYDCTFQDPKVQQKSIDKNMEIRGYENPMQDPEVRKKLKEIHMEKRGFENPMMDPEVQEKGVQTNQRKRSVNYPMEDLKVRKKAKETKYNNFLKKFDIILEYLKLELLDEKYIHAGYKHNWKCLNCNIVFKQIWSAIQQGYLCPNCRPNEKFKISKGEEQVNEFIKSLNISDNIFNSNRFLIKPLELDIYIPDKKLAIEYNGLYHHCLRVLYKTRKNLNIPIENYHLYKTEQCLKQDIQLIHIFEDEWIFKQDIVKSRLKQILGVNSNKRIHARECIIKEIDPKRKNEFLEEFHIQGKDNSVIKLGAFFGEDLVSVMTFSKGNISKGSKSIEGVWELNRFCSDSNFHIPGIAGKLLSHFKKNYQWLEIFSYADRRWSQGNLYYKLGFELVHKTKPNYWYVDLNKFERIHRFSLRKRPDEPKDISERILRMNDGYETIWDCGSLKFQLVNTEK